MTNRRFIALAAILITLFLFLKIYQHNVVTNLSYTLNEAERRIAMHKATTTQRSIELMKLKNADTICRRAEEELELQPIHLTAIRRV